MHVPRIVIADVVQADAGVAELINQTFGLVPRIPWDEQVSGGTLRNKNHVAVVLIQWVLWA